MTAMEINEADVTEILTALLDNTYLVVDQGKPEESNILISTDKTSDETFRFLLDRGQETYVFRVSVAREETTPVVE